MKKEPKKILEKYWGYENFRPLQEDIINSILAGKDTLALMPTGGGKSITFQVPALILDGICLVVTPLVALMKDQVNALHQKGIKAEAIYTGLTYDEIKQTINRCLFSDIKLLYVSPERLESSVFKNKLEQMNLSFIAVDEAHCISQWGYDFRPAYLNIAAIRNSFPNIPILAVTATATTRVVKDIQLQLKFKESAIFKKSFERNNLSYLVRTVEDKPTYLLRILNRSKGSAIVYVRSRKKTKEIANFLQTNGINSTYFHAGLPNEIKHQRQIDWTMDKKRVIVATNAFGMGIDKPNVRVVIHLDLPDSLEAYFQEAGRAGRDGKPSFAVLLYHKQDKGKLTKRIGQNYPKKEIILKTYTALCNFFSLEEGYDAGFTSALDISKFVTIFKLSIIHTYSSLNILRNAKVINFIEELDSPSRITFRIRRDDLYQYKNQNATTTNLIDTILRLYPGIFTDYVKINEYQIAERMNKPVERIKEWLVFLSKEKIIHYIPHRKSPYVSFPDGRIPLGHISLKRAIYKDKKTQYKKQIKAIINYVESKYRCRSQILLAYFDDYSSKPCGQCDVCLNIQKKTPSKTQIEAISTTILKKLEIPTEIYNLEMEFEDLDLFHLALYELLDTEKIELTNENLLKICKK